MKFFKTNSLKTSGKQSHAWQIGILLTDSGKYRGLYVRLTRCSVKGTGRPGFTGYIFFPDLWRGR